MLRDLRGWPTPAPILAAAAALDFGVVTYMIVRRLHPPPPGSRAPPQVTRRMAAAVLGELATRPSLQSPSQERPTARPGVDASQRSCCTLLLHSGACRPGLVLSCYVSTLTSSLR